MKKVEGLFIPMEVGDMIVVASLKEQIGYLKKDNKKIRKLDDIPDFRMQDLISNEQFIRHATAVIEYYGG